MNDLKPSEIVIELDKYIIGQENAKRSVAIALRNRWRRQQVPEDIRDEIAPKNIILIGPTGVGKTEIARRLSSLTESPFTKVEASKFTEIGYIGRDVESMVRDLLDLTVNKLKLKEQDSVQEKAAHAAEEKILDLLLPKPKGRRHKTTEESSDPPLEIVTQCSDDTSHTNTREKLRAMLKNGKLDSRYLDLDVSEKAPPVVEIFSNMGIEEMGLNIKEMIGGMMPKNVKRRKLKVPEALDILIAEETQNLLDMEKVINQAIKKVEQSGIIFLDEIDKITGKNGSHGPDVSREGVQRDLLPIVEGCTVATKYGPVETDHILFIASGAFHACKPSDLIPELQGRFPIRVELNSLGQAEFVRILTEPKNALVLQYHELIKTEGIKITFQQEAIEEIAKIAEDVNNLTDNIGARRLHTLMERLLDEVLFDAPDMLEKTITINRQYVNDKLKDIKNNEDLSRYIL